MTIAEHALIVAGGKGTRMKSVVPKQFIEVNGLPILIHTIEAFFKYNENITVILVLPENDFDRWHSLIKKYNYHRPVILQEGGNTRFQSVKNGLQKIQPEGLVAIHDGVRPLVSTDIIASSFKLASIHGSAVASVPLKESIRKIEQDQTKALDRSQFKLIQTPQTFKTSLIKQAYELKEDETLTDDASVAERAGHSIFLFDGSYRNIKVTTEEDLILVSALLSN